MLNAEKPLLAIDLLFQQCLLGVGNGGKEPSLTKELRQSLN